jgi:hypothetical protein
LTTTKQKRLETLVEQVRSVAQEIGFRPVTSGRRSRIRVLAAELDARGIKPPRQPRPHERSWLCNWSGVVDTAPLRRFLKTYLPKFLTADSPVVANRVSKMVSKAELAKPTSKSVSKSEPVTPQTSVSPGPNLNGWTIRKDKHGYFRAYRKIAGKTKSIYLGKSLVGAELKLTKREPES